MPWKVHHWGEDPRVDAIVVRRFGSRHDQPCAHPTILTCAQWDCQVRNRCIHLPLVEEAGHAALADEGETS